MSARNMTHRGSSGTGTGSGRLVEGLVLGALTGAAIYLGWKTGNENRKVSVLDDK